MVFISTGLPRLLAAFYLAVIKCFYIYFCCCVQLMLLFLLGCPGSGSPVVCPSPCLCRCLCLFVFWGTNWKNQLEGGDQNTIMLGLFVVIKSMLDIVRNCSCGLPGWLDLSWAWLGRRWVAYGIMILPFSYCSGNHQPPDLCCKAMSLVSYYGRCFVHW